MKKVIIRNLGPVKDAALELRRVNLIIGPQSSGKSCILKTASYCTWVEKQIELTQSYDRFTKDSFFIKEFVRFHKLSGFVKPDTYIGYESDFMAFSFDNNTKEFKFEWKSGRWNYRRSQISYIPSERNLVAAIPNWLDVKFKDDNIRSFMAEWERARKMYTKGLPVLNLGVNYKFDRSSQEDKIDVGDGVTLDFTNTSSGLQSLIPMFVHLDYISRKQHSVDKEESISQKNVSDDFLNTMYKELFEDTGKTDADVLYTRTAPDGRHEFRVQGFFSTIGHRTLFFSDDEHYNECLNIYNQYMDTDHCDVFVEEPENNLFPPTQCRLAEWLIDLSNGEDKDVYQCNIFVATHSPYLLTSFLEKNLEDFALLLVDTTNGCSKVKTASKDDIADIYDNGVDAFFNLESFV